MRSFIFILFTKYHYGDQIKDEVIDEHTARMGRCDLHAKI